MGRMTMVRVGRMCGCGFAKVRTPRVSQPGSCRFSVPRGVSRSGGCSGLSFRCENAGTCQEVPGLLGSHPAGSRQTQEVLRRLHAPCGHSRVYDDLPGLSAPPPSEDEDEGVPGLWARYGGFQGLLRDLPGAFADQDD